MVNINLRKINLFTVSSFHLLTEKNWRMETGFSVTSTISTHSEWRQANQWLLRVTPFFFPVFPPFSALSLFHLSQLSESLAQVRLRLVMYPIETSNYLTEGKVMILNRWSVVWKLTSLCSLKSGLWRESNASQFCRKVQKREKNHQFFLR